MIRILPQAFYENPDMQKVLVDGLSCVVHKKVHETVSQKEGYLSTHAITLVLNGTLKAENESGAVSYVRKNQMIFMPKGLHTVSDIVPNGDPFEAVVFFFDETLIREFVQSLKRRTIKDKCVAHLLLDYTESVRIFTESLLQLYGKMDQSRHKLAKAKLFELLHLISLSEQGECFMTALFSLNNKEKKSLRSFMGANFSKPLSVEDYAYLTGRSLSTFRRDFKSQFGISPKQWLIEKRMEKARTLLEHNRNTVTDVAFETGYENISHFIKAFHKMYGIPPKQFLIRQRREIFV